MGPETYCLLPGDSVVPPGHKHVSHFTFWCLQPGSFLWDPTPGTYLSVSRTAQTQHLESPLLCVSSLTSPCLKSDAPRGCHLIEWHPRSSSGEARNRTLPPQSLMDFFKLYFLINFSWSRVALQCCVSFCLTAKGTSPLCFGFPSHLGHRRALSRVPLLPGGLSSVINCINSSVYVSIPASQFIPPPLFPPGVHSLFSSSVYLFCKYHLYHFSRFHTYALIYDICFSLSDLLHSVLQPLG